MNIKTKLNKEDYETLKAKARIENTYYIETKIIVSQSLIDGETDAVMGCLRLILDDGGYTVSSGIIPPTIKFGFKLMFSTSNEDLIKEILKKDDIFIDDKKYYLGDYNVQINPLETHKPIFNANFISYDLED